jgi:hypothetical protein
MLCPYLHIFHDESSSLQLQEQTMDHDLNIDVRSGDGLCKDECILEVFFLFAYCAL